MFNFTHNLVINHFLVFIHSFPNKSAAFLQFCFLLLQLIMVGMTKLAYYFNLCLVPIIRNPFIIRTPRKQFLLMHNINATKMCILLQTPFITNIILLVNARIRSLRLITSILLQNSLQACSGCRILVTVVIPFLLILAWRIIMRNQWLRRRIKIIAIRPESCASPKLLACPNLNQVDIIRHTQLGVTFTKRESGRPQSTQNGLLDKACGGRSIIKRKVHIAG
mmetsp:Transcript_31674/g.51250  ORF Transcript_31674/g.51250 Transcript_31674/m.51250 type:complete len:222 (+) Transcript_31674:215-880(+)